MISTLNHIYLFDLIGVFNLPNPSLIAIKEGLLALKVADFVKEEFA